MSRSEKWLLAYSGLLTLVLAVVLLTGAADARSAKFDRIEVQRIDLREADGTLRMVISNRGRFPGAIFHGREYPHPRGAAGMIFYNDEGTENGGLIFGGRRVDGKVVDAGGSLTFDQFENDQVVQLLGTQDGDRETAGMIVNDRPQRSLEEYLKERPKLDAMPAAEREALTQARAQRGEFGQQRLFVGRNRERASLVALRDADGRERLRLRVAPEGLASIEFLDAQGRVQRTLGPEAAAAK